MPKPMVGQFTADGELIAKHGSLREAAEAVGRSHQNVHTAIKKKWSCGGFKWKYITYDGDPVEWARTPKPASVKFKKNDDGKLVWEEDHGEGTAYAKAYNEAGFSNLDEALDYCGVDQTVWKVLKHRFGGHTTPMKLKKLVNEDGKEVKVGVKFNKNRVLSYHEPIKVQNTTVQIWFVRQDNFIEELKESLIALVKPAKPMKKVFPTVANHKKRVFAVEPCIFDHHLGKRGFDSKTMEFNWSIEEAGQEYNNVTDWMLSHVNPKAIKEFIVPVCNDMLHVDNNYGTTTRGTQLLGEVFWLKLFKYGRILLTEQITRLAAIAPVIVYVVPGNHDEISSLAMGEVLDATFKDHPDVSVVNTGALRLYHRFGISLIGYNHGNDVSDPAKYAHAMNVDVPELLAETKQRFFHLGDKHRRVKQQVYVRTEVQEDMGTEIEICSALSPTDRWHDKNLFIGPMRRSRCFVYHEEHGQVHNLIYNLP